MEAKEALKIPSSDLAAIARIWNSHSKSIIIWSNICLKTYAKTSKPDYITDVIYYQHF